MKFNILHKIYRTLRQVLCGSILMATPLIIASCGDTAENLPGGANNTIDAIENLKLLVVGDGRQEIDGLKYDATMNSFFLGISPDGLSPDFTDPGCRGFFMDTFGNHLNHTRSIALADINITESLDTDGFSVFDVEFPPIILTGDGINTGAGEHIMLVKLRFGFINDDANNAKIQPPGVSGTYTIAIYDFKVTCDGHRVDNFDSTQGQGEGEYVFYN